MSEQKQSTFSIEELNKQFQQQYEFSEEPNKKTKKLKKWIVWMALAVCIITVVILGVGRLKNPYKITTYSGISSESEYQKQYESVNQNTAFIGVNETVNISDQYAHVGLVNAAGSDCIIVIKIYDKETEEIFYQSEKIRPGTVLHIAVLDQPITNADSAVIDYIVYDLEENERGVYPVDIEFNYQ